MNFPVARFGSVSYIASITDRKPSQPAPECAGVMCTLWN
jgi:hypothetical protein